MCKTYLCFQIKQKKRISHLQQKNLSTEMYLLGMYLIFVAHSNDWPILANPTDYQQPSTSQAWANLEGNAF